MSEEKPTSPKKKFRELPAEEQKRLYRQLLVHSRLNEIREDRQKKADEKEDKETQP